MRGGAARATGLGILAAAVLAAPSCGRRPDRAGERFVAARPVLRPAPHPGDGAAPGSAPRETLAGEPAAFGLEPGRILGWTLDGEDLPADQALPLRLEKKLRGRFLTREVRGPASAVTSVALRARCPAGAEVSLRWTREDGAGDSVDGYVRTEAEAFETVILDLASHPAWRGEIRRVELVVFATGPFAIESARWIALPLDARLPALERQHGARPRIGGESREGRYLAAGRPLLAGPVELRAGDRIELGLGIPEETAAREAGPPRVRVEAGDWQQTIEGPRAPGWHDLVLGGEAPLPAGRAALRFSLEGAPGDYAALATPRILRAAADRRPNVLLLTADTLRADVLGCYGNAKTRTPALDALASEGILYENVTAAANATTPAHASLFTSLYPKDHGVLGNSGRLPQGALTLARLFAGEGYATAAAVGAFVLDADLSGMAQGFDLYDQPEEPYGSRRAGEVHARILPWIQDHARQRFFVWIHDFDAHDPYDPPEPFRSWYETRGAASSAGGAPAEVPASDAAPPDRATRRALYRGEVSYLDHEIGELLAALDRMGLAPRTVVAFTADHGEQLGERRYFDQDYFGHEGIYTSTIRIPWILRIPGGPAGLHIPAAVEQIDIAPTILALAGLAVPPGMRGAPRSPGPSGEVAGRDERYFQHRRGTAVGVRAGSLHAVLRLSTNPLPPSRRLELFDLTRDPQTLHNISRERGDVAAAMEQRLRRWLEDRRDLARVEGGGLDGGPGGPGAPGTPGGEAVLTDERREALEALGYGTPLDPDAGSGG